MAARPSRLSNAGDVKKPRKLTTATNVVAGGPSSPRAGAGARAGDTSGGSNAEARKRWRQAIRRVIDQNRIDRRFGCARAGAGAAKAAQAAFSPRNAVASLRIGKAWLTLCSHTAQLGRLGLAHGDGRRAL